MTWLEVGFLAHCVALWGMIILLCNDLWGVVEVEGPVAGPGGATFPGVVLEGAPALECLGAEDDVADGGGAGSKSGWPEEPLGEADGGEGEGMFEWRDNQLFIVGTY
ncbi:hypothetical protein JB92DRAFT_2831961 [Gautieria morchelliformis]|nr:hypothetical protein JB92DRAFT_2831961 [Gautieria morchelliformis]